MNKMSLFAFYFNSIITIDYNLYHFFNIQAVKLIMHDIETSPLPAVIKGKSDWREYRSLSLPNGVTCVLVQDEESKTTACSVSVAVGASADPRELSGLAHFCEHMCFLGSEAYPGENEFKSYLSYHGGRSNASTSMSQTCYKFDVLADAAEKVIDIFANFFIAPLFTQSGTSREVNAVDSENSKNESNDGRRRLQILKALADPNHHYSKFSTGNSKTLPAVNEDKAEFVREALLAFHKKHYTPENMTVVVVGPQSLDTLEEWIVPRFARVQNNFEEKSQEELSKAEKLVDMAATDLPKDSFGCPPVPYNPAFKAEVQKNQWPVLLTTKPLQSLRKLYLYFPLPSTREYGDQSPYALLGHLMGHEGKGSIFSDLQNKELITSLSAGPRLADVDQSLMQINISLTEKGEEQWQDVVSIVFQYCKMLQRTCENVKNGDEKDMHELHRIWDEIITVRKLNFDQTSPSNAYSFAPNFANSVRKNGTEKSLSIGSLLEETKESLPFDLFSQFLSQMTPENCFIERCSKNAWKEATGGDEEIPDANPDDIFGLKVEQWYGVKYHLSPIDKSIVKLWNEGFNPESTCLRLPDKNEFIARDLSLCDDLPEEARNGPRISHEMNPPNLVSTDSFGRLWHRLDDRYCLPKSSISILLRTPSTNNALDQESNKWIYDTDTAMHSSILLNVFSDALAQETYDAEIAGLHWNLSNTPSGLILRCSGYSEHLPKYTLHILSLFFADQKKTDGVFLEEKYLSAIKDRFLRSLSSYFESKRADTYASYYTGFLLSSESKGIYDTIRATESIDLSSLQRHHHNLISNCKFEVDCLVGGNISIADAEMLFDGIKSIVEGTSRMDDVKRKIITGKFTFGNNDYKLSVEVSNILVDNQKGPIERKLKEGEEVHLHFQSQNTEEQNGCVLMSFQSSTPAFKGRHLSTKESLVQSAAVRTICHMIREPMFNQLRTKEQLGYIVSAYYDNNLSCTSNKDQSSLDEASTFLSSTTPIDSLVINVLSKKVPPPVLTQRIDEFLDTFGDKLK